MVEVVPQLVHPGHRQPLRLQRGQRLRQVLAVLAAAGVRGVGAGGEHGDPAVAVLDHLAEGVGEVRGPVAVAPVHRQFEAVVREVLAQRLQKRTVLCVDRAHAAEEEVVLADFFEPFLGDAAAARHVREERDDVVRAFGTTEGQQEKGVVGSGITQIGHVPDPATRLRQRGTRHRQASGVTGPP